MMKNIPTKWTHDHSANAGAVVVRSIPLPPREKLSRAGISLVKDEGRWWVTPTNKPDLRIGNGFRTKAEAQKEALASVRVAENSK